MKPARLWTIALIILIGSPACTRSSVSSPDAPLPLVDSVSRPEKPLDAATVRKQVGGEYWVTYFRGTSPNASVANFYMFGIMPVTFGKDGTFKSGDLFGDGAWKVDPTGMVVLSFDEVKPTGRRSKFGPEGTSLSFVASDLGDVLSAAQSIKFAVDENRFRLLRNRVATQVQWLGTYDQVRHGTQIKNTDPLALTAHSARFMGRDNKWIAAGPYVVVIGFKDPIYRYPSFVFLADPKAKTLAFVPSDTEPGFDDASWGLVYKRS